MEEKEIKKEKPNKEKKEKKEGKSTFSKVMNWILWFVVFFWIGLCVTDYVMTIQEKDPVFCLKEETKEYNDGTVYICTGVGYKYIRYDRLSYSATQFGGFWIKEHNPKE